jgi:hypothetical protein
MSMPVANEALVVEAQHYAVGWETLALLNAGIVQGKNRSGLNGFLLSLLLGPIASFLLVAFFEKLWHSRSEHRIDHRFPVRFDFKIRSPDSPALHECGSMRPVAVPAFTQLPPTGPAFLSPATSTS